MNFFSLLETLQGVFFQIFQPPSPVCKESTVSLGLEDFAIGLVSFVLSLPNGQVKFFYNSNNRRTVYSNPPIKNFWG